MKRPFCAYVATLAGALLSLATGAPPALAQGCQPFTVTSDGSDRFVEHVDLNEAGASSADMRLGYRALLDQDGRPVGHIRWVELALDGPPSNEHSSETFGNIVLSLNGGQILAQSLTENVRPVDNTSQSSAESFSAAVVGGTGAFTFARGKIDIAIDGADVTYAVVVKCD